MEIQQTADTHNAKNFYNGLKAIYGSQSCGTAPLHSIDISTLITHLEGIRKHLTEHFDSILNHPFTIADEVIDACGSGGVVKLQLWAAAQVQEGTDRLPLQPNLDVGEAGVQGGVDHAAC